MGKDLIIASAVGDLQWIRLCIDKGASPTYINEEGWGALHMAAMHSKLDCVKFLVENLSIDPDITSQTGWTPLQLSSRSKPESVAIDCVNYLMSKGADPNKTNDMGISSIHQAVSANNLQCVKSLVKNGARVTYTDKRGLSPLDVAKVWGHTECSKYLENVMWLDKKEEEENRRKRWILEHKKMLDHEIQKYVDAKQSGKAQDAYKSWINRKKLSSPRIPSRCEARARPLTCFNEESIHEYHKKKLSQKVLKNNLVSLRPQTSPRQTFERVKKIQELRSMITSRDMSVVARDKSPTLLSKQRDVTSTLRNITPHSAPPQYGKSLSKSPSDHTMHTYRISKLSEPKTCPAPAKESPRKRKKRRKPRTSGGSSPTPEFHLKVDNYFTTPSSSSSPDSGYVEESPSPVLRPKMLQEYSQLEVESVYSDAETRPTDKHEDALESFTLKAEISTKTVRFSDDILYDTEHKSYSFGHRMDQIRSCMKVKNLHIG